MNLANAMRRLTRRAGSLRVDRAQRRLLPGLLADLDAERFEALRARYTHADFNPIGPLKYFDLPTYLGRSLRRAVRLGLHRAAPCRVLDLGCGFGYFLYVCSHFGHRGVGLDYVDGNHPDVECYEATLELLGQRRVLHHIVQFEELPHLEGAFDLITAYEICFNWHEKERDQAWGIPEWQFFLRDLKTRLARGGRIILEFNPLGPGRPCFDDALAEYFRASRARLLSDRKTVIFDAVDSL
jgi:SAM-dependent methyltransferase